jgi:hypothetical protein
MMNISLFTPLHFILPVILSVSLLFCQDSAWIGLDDGLWFGSFDLPPGYAIEDAKINIIRIDPEKYAFKLLCAAELDHNNLGIKEWGERYHLVAAINAGMFQTDYRTNVGYMKNGNYVNNPDIHPDYFSVFAFNPDNKNDRFWPLPNILGVVKKINSNNQK